jgi:hypothetical protein
VSEPQSSARPIFKGGVRQWRRGFTPAFLAVAVFLAAILVPVGLMLYSAVRGGEPLVLVRTAADAIVAAATTGGAASASVTLQDLDELAPGEHPLEISPPPSGYASLDAVTALPWAQTIAEAWVKDARLNRVDVVRVRADGLIDVAADQEAEVTYRFVSPDRIKELRRRADRSANANAQTELWVRLNGGAASVVAPTTPAALLAFREHEGLAPEPPQALPLETMFAKLTRPPFKAPFYRGYLLYTEGEGWVWYISTLSGDALPHVRSTDGRVHRHK